MIKVIPKLTGILNERNMTQSKLSELSGVPQSAISRFDRNSQHSDIHVFAIARALGLRADDLFEVLED
ncbi:helix-turn-helix transcriptional regulator [Paenibacillus vini]|uniref:helix-turn-helix domain-containing protein n=1 Tax=Paenibacillus vini TaxID=1476024 RepID=UPI0025B64C52|nr:helix-turn-helix transcriptional regulator [Paenibacillus vini]MDN4070866.1 helix-turn-helix transcriptional regulator [Paenibacillus vini]